MKKLLTFSVLAMISLATAGVGKAAADVRAHGAKGDGKTDDSDAIQKAVADADGAVTFGKGTYRLTRTIVIDLDTVGFTSLSGDGTAQIRMEGAGPAFKFIGTHAGTAAPESIKPNVWERQRTPMVGGLEIVGAHAEADGIEASGTMQLTVTRTVIREARHGIRLSGRNRNVLIADCHLYHNRGIGLFLDDVDLHQINVSASHISYNAQGGIVSLKGAVRNLHISGCDIESNMSPENPPTANVLIDATGSASGTAEVAITGCTLQHNSNAPDSANIRIIGQGNPTPEQPLVRWGHVTITGNVLSDVYVNVHLRHVRGVVLTGNTFWMGVEHDLLVEESSNIVVGPNIFDRNPKYQHGTAPVSKGGVHFRRVGDATLSGLHLNGIQRKAAAVHLQQCDRVNVTNLTILDSDRAGVLLDRVSRSRVSGCLIRDDREGAPPSASIRAKDGRQNVIVDNVLSRAAEVEGGNAVVRDNTVTD
jgi:hypothetical protein